MTAGSLSVGDRLQLEPRRLQAVRAVRVGDQLHGVRQRRGLRVGQPGAVWDQGRDGDDGGS